LPEIGHSDEGAANMTDENLEYPFDSRADTSRRQPVEEPPKPAGISIFIYAAILAGIGVLVGVVFFTMPWLFGNAKGRYDLGTVVSSPDDLNGHLYTRWNEQLEYRLKIEPGDESQLAGFSLAVSNLPRPVSFYIQLFDADSKALCSMHILMKYDPANAEEQEREHDNNLFQDIYGPTGQIVAISSEGTMPCSQRAWSKPGVSSPTFLPLTNRLPWKMTRSTSWPPQLNWPLMRPLAIAKNGERRKTSRLFPSRQTMRLSTMTRPGELSKPNMEKHSSLRKAEKKSIPGGRTIP
jgi:hypothetical protein